MVLKSARPVDGGIIKNWFIFFCVTSPLLCHLQYRAFLEDILQADALYVPQASNLPEVDWRAAASFVLFIIFWWASFPLSLSHFLFSQYRVSAGRGNTLTSWRPAMATGKDLPPASAEEALAILLFLFFIFCSGHVICASYSKHGATARQLPCYKREMKNSGPTLFSNWVVLIFTWKQSRSTWTLRKYSETTFLRQVRPEA